MRQALAAILPLSLLLAHAAHADEIIGESSHWDDDHRTIYTDVTVLRPDGSVYTQRVIGGEVDGIAQVQFALYGGLVSTDHTINDYVQTKTAGGVALRWHESCVFMTPDTAGSADVSFDDELAAIDGAAAAWTTGMAACGYMNLQRTTPAATDLGNDGVNAVVFHSTGCAISCGPSQWCRPAHGSNPDVCYDGAATAITTATFVKDGSSDAGRILDADVEINSVQWAFAVGCETTCMTMAQGATPSTTVDLQNTLTHEFGHVLGLDHTCWVGTGTDPTDNLGNPIPDCFPASALPVSVTSATMYNLEAPGEVSKRTPEADDIAGVCADYPLAKDPKKCETALADVSSSSGCAVATHGNGGAALLLLLALAGCYTARLAPRSRRLRPRARRTSRLA